MGFCPFNAGILPDVCPGPFRISYPIFRRNCGTTLWPHFQLQIISHDMQICLYKSYFRYLDSKIYFNVTWLRLTPVLAQPSVSSFLQKPSLILFLLYKNSNSHLGSDSFPPNPQIFHPIGRTFTTLFSFGGPKLILSLYQLNFPGIILFLISFLSLP